MAATVPSKSDLQSLPGVTTNPDKATHSSVFNHTMYRIKDPERSLDFYTRILGMRLLQKLDFPEMQFSLYFLAFLRSTDEIPEDSKERVAFTFAQPGRLELTHNWGAEKDPDFKVANGNDEPKGYGHIGVSVPDVAAACERFEQLGVNFVKKPNDGKMKGLAFITDPDGYYVEILNCESAAESFG